MHRRQGVTAVSSLALQLPPSTHNPYYYDVVGNVSTSRFRPSPSTSNKAVLPSHANKKRREPAVLELQPRYPILGGWNYSFTIGYDLPLAEYVKMRSGAKKGQYVAAVPFLTPVKDVAVDNVRVEVRLPEGARCVPSLSLFLALDVLPRRRDPVTHAALVSARRDIAVHAPFPLTSLSFPSSASDGSKNEGTVAWTYLDSTGRPTVVMTKRACSDRHGQDVLVRPSFSPSPLLALSLAGSRLSCASLTLCPPRYRRSSTRSLPSPTPSKSRSRARPSSLRSLSPSSWPSGCLAGSRRQRR